MIVDIKSGTDSASHAMFDPLAVPYFLNSGDPGKSLGELDEASERGDIFAFSEASDGSLEVKIYIEEPAPENLIGRAAQDSRGCLFRAPDGRIFVSGAEYMFPMPETPLDPNQFQSQAGSLGGCFQIPAGNYALDAYWIDWEESRPKSADSPISPVRNFVRKLGCAGFLACLPVAGIAAFVAREHAYLILILSGVFLLLSLLGTKFAPASSQRAHRLRASNPERRNDYADIVIELKRTPEDLDVSKMKGGALWNPVHF